MTKRDNNDSAFSTGLVFVLVGLALLLYGHYIIGPALLIFGVLAMMGARAERKKLEEMEEEVVRPTITVTRREDSQDYTFSIKGINFRELDDSLLGDFVGTARALKSNPHDPYAIGVYIGSRRVGFLPGGNADLHARILEMGGSVDAEGYIAKGTDEDDGHEFFYGKVTLLM